MNYGKLAYLKVSELEKLSLGSSSESVSSGINCFEINRENLNEAFSDALNLDFATITANASCDCCIFLNFKFTATTETSISIKLSFNNMLVSTFSKTLKEGENDITVSSVASSIINNTGLLSASITTSESITLSGYNLIAIGASTSQASSNIELKACENENNITISYIKNQMLYYYSSNLNEIDLLSCEWQEFKPAKTHSVCYDVYNSNGLITFLYVGLDDNLYLSRIGENEEMFIDSGVSSVCVGNSSNSYDDCMFIVYIKNGNVLYRTINNNILSNAVEIGLPEAHYSQVRTISGQSYKNYIIATDNNQNNYICSSVMAPSIAKLFENVKFEISLDLLAYGGGLDEDIGIENISCKLAISALCYRFADKLYNMEDINHLEFECNFGYECYEDVEDAIIYGVDFDTTSENSSDWIGNCVYVEDCANFEPATITFNDPPVFSEGSWTNLWPFNAIKPCLLKDGEVVCYLNQVDLTKSEDGTLTNLDISSGESGDVMVEIPRIYYRFHQTENGVWQFRISNAKKFGYNCFSHYFKGEVLDKIYVGAFTSTLIDGKAYSLSDCEKVLASKLTQQQLREYSLLRGENFGMPNFGICILLQMLFVIYFKSLHYRQSIGIGYMNASSTGIKTSGMSNAYPSRTYGYSDTNGLTHIDRFLNIEGFCSFGLYCVDGVYSTYPYSAIMDVEGPHNNWIDDEKHQDYMMWEAKYLTSHAKTIRNEINNYIGLFPVEFLAMPSTATSGIDFSRCRITLLSSPFYRMHFPSLGNVQVGVFAYMLADSGYSNNLLGHRLVYFKSNKEN